ncbi:glycosyltransferase family 4 protein [Salinimicrobium terrae]|uniref:glycosyltransferase family 4 protein n=1 Tax=Salinimicrobium terrae TaxID=470866 RepID=UPI000423E947|nr:glycosyltransferase family 4 protein [Salinimicrobium terrae]
MRQKILIVGPIEDLGGRELEAGFVASVLKEDFDVSVLSTGNLTHTSQFYETADGIQMVSLKQLLYKRYWPLRPASFLSYLKNRRKAPRYFYVNNKFNSKFIKSRENEILKEHISNHDLVFIIAHLETLRTREIIEYCDKMKKPVIFRTTGEISNQTFPLYLHKVAHFLHHSMHNAQRLHEKLSEITWSKIDQTAFFEDKLLDIPCVDKIPTAFGVIGRLSPEKNLENLISYFSENGNEKDTLYIVGDGELGMKLKMLSANRSNIEIIGSIAYQEVSEFFKKIHCFIVASYTEAGPLVGVEAMAAGKLILSTKVGAMPERLQETDNDFWFEPDDERSFREQFERIKSLDPSQVYEIAGKNREVYIERYSKRTIAEEYLSSVKQILKNN